MQGKNPRQGAGSEQHPWDLKRIEKLIDLLIDKEVAEFEMEQDGLRVRIRRSHEGQQEAVPPPAAYGAPAQEIPLPTPVPVAVPAESGERAADSADGLYIIKSPIVGTFYSSPSPNAASFVKPGDVVQVGQVLCIIEAMKLMNEIESEAAGEIVRIYVENGQPVEYGQSLFAIKPSHKK